MPTLLISRPKAFWWKKLEIWHLLRKVSELHGLTSRFSTSAFRTERGLMPRPESGASGRRRR